MGLSIGHKVIRIGENQRPARDPPAQTYRPLAFGETTPGAVTANVASKDDSLLSGEPEAARRQPLEAA